MTEQSIQQLLDGGHRILIWKTKGVPGFGTSYSTAVMTPVMRKEHNARISTMSHYEADSVETSLAELADACRDKPLHDDQEEGESE